MAKDKKQTQVLDPLEGSKIASKPEVIKPIAPPVVVDPPAPPAAVHEPARKIARYKVVESGHVSINGQITRLNKDDIISEHHYGPDVVQKILTSKVPLMKIEE